MQACHSICHFRVLELQQGEIKVILGTHKELFIFHCNLQWIIMKCHHSNFKGAPHWQTSIAIQDSPLPQSTSNSQFEQLINILWH